jgi:hypothetical protein
MVPADSDELRIYELLLRAGLDVVREHCIIPVLDILALRQVSFVILPRWEAFYMQERLGLNG